MTRFKPGDQVKLNRERAKAGAKNPPAGTIKDHYQFALNRVGKGVYTVTYHVSNSFLCLQELGGIKGGGYLADLFDPYDEFLEEVKRANRMKP